MKISILIGAFLLMCSTVLPSIVHALTISPTKIEIAGDPGQTVIGEIELFNEQNEQKTFYTSYENFEPRGETGSPYFVGRTSGLATWISTPESVTINPGDRVTIPYSVTIPADAAPGGYFAAVFLGSQPAQNGQTGSDVSVGGKVGSLVLLRVNGDVAESGGLLEFRAADGRFWFSHVPVSFTYRFNNTGGDRVVPRGELKVTNVFGQEVASLSANSTEGSVLPSSVRRFDTIWDMTDEDLPVGFWSTAGYQFRHFRFGLYKASINVLWGDSEQKASAVTRVFVFPWQLMTVIFSLLIGLIILLKFYNKLIIARAKRSV